MSISAMTNVKIWQFNGVMHSFEFFAWVFLVLRHKLSGTIFIQCWLNSLILQRLAFDDLAQI